jgi:hypothetical protein
MSRRLDLQWVKVTSLVCGAAPSELTIYLGVPNLVMRYILTCCVCLSPKLILCFIFSLVNFEIIVFGTNSSASESLLRGSLLMFLM